MNKNALILVALLSLAATAIATKPNNLRLPAPDEGMPTAEYMAYHDYPYEAHWVTTEDGYILKYNRIQTKYEQIKEGKPVIFLHHGLLDNSDTWIINDETLAPAFILANAGYDVWMGNSRGNMFGRNHTTMNPDTDPEFWQFSFDEMAKYDLPAGFAFIANYTGQEKIDYIGHSQGSTIMFIALSQRYPGVVNHLKRYFAYGPVAHVNHVSSPVFLGLAKYHVDVAFALLGVHEVFAYSWLKHPILEQICGYFGKLCRSFLGPISDTDPELDNYRRMDVMIGHDPAGTSLMNLQHWKQMMGSGKFQGYNHGAVGNLKAYGTVNPPQYDLTKITEKVHLFAGSSDSLADPTDVAYLRTQLSNQWFKEYDAGHLTFLWGLKSEATYDALEILREEI